jgi:hypothetical protein
MHLYLKILKIKQKSMKIISNTKKMEKIQERALKFIYSENHSTYEELLAKSKLPSLKIRRIPTTAIETFKIIKNK